MYPDHIEDLIKNCTLYKSHKEFVDNYTKEDFDFIFDINENLYICKTDIQHVVIMSELFYYYTQDKEKSMWDAADLFIELGLGIFKSRAGNKIYVSRKFGYPLEYKPILRDIEVL